ncbi:hypothetical protein F2Q68_00020644 [Brassica cretica]|uniref:Uncharacterized protein n=1 Tax=Brassica cretica TaxID=69181 RepID=A0A8S9FMW5_BRACR|nr:hypothetical protein F2Q68_00020644 [Brassica cretica]
MDSCRYLATELWSVVSGLLALLKVERDKIGAAPYDGCLRTLVEGIKPFVVSLGVKFSAVCKLAGFLKTLEYWQRDKFWDLVSRFLILCLEMLETSALGLGQDLGLLLVLEGAMTNSTYVSRFSFILIPYRFKVRDREVICIGILPRSLGSRETPSCPSQINHSAWKPEAGDRTQTRGQEPGSRRQGPGTWRREPGSRKLE